MAVGPEVDPEIWWVVPEDNPFSIGPLQVGQGMVGGRGFGQDLAPCPLVTSEAEVLRNSNGRLDFPGPTQEAS